MEHFEVQLIGGIVLHQGRIAEMKTGEGKTLVATLPSYLNAWKAKVFTLSQSMITWRNVMPTRWDRFTDSLG